MQLPAMTGITWATVGALHDDRLVELSGIAASRTSPGTYWVHNDSGDIGRIFAIGLDGAVRGVTRFTTARVSDCEDVAMGPALLGATRPTIWVGDIGDNHLRRDHITLWRMTEPDPSATVGSRTATAQHIDVRYPEGWSRNAETLMVDPRTGDAFIVTKSKTAGNAQLYRLPAATPWTGSTATLEACGPLAVGPLATGGDISPDGHTIVVRTYEGMYEWHRRDGETVQQAMARAPQRFDAPSSEAIGFTADGATLVSVAEGHGADIMEAPVPSVTES